jgi:hypothetical protein
LVREESFEQPLEVARQIELDAAAYAASTAAAAVVADASATEEDENGPEEAETELSERN